MPDSGTTSGSLDGLVLRFKEKMAGPFGVGELFPDVPLVAGDGKGGYHSRARFPFFVRTGENPSLANRAFGRLFYKMGF